MLQLPLGTEGFIHTICGNSFTLCINGQQTSFNMNIYGQPTHYCTEVKNRPDGSKQAWVYIMRSGRRITSMAFYIPGWIEYFSPVTTNHKPYWD